MGAGQDHEETVDADARAAGGRHAVLERAEEFFVHFVALGAGLLFEAAALLDRVIQLAVAGSDFSTRDLQFEDVGERRIILAGLCEGNQPRGKPHDEGRLAKMSFYHFLIHLMGEFVHAAFRVDIEVVLGGFLPGVCFRQVKPVIAKVFLHYVVVRHFPPRRRQVDGIIAFTELQQGPYVYLGTLGFTAFEEVGLDYFLEVRESLVSGLLVVVDDQYEEIYAQGGFHWFNCVNPDNCHCFPIGDPYVPRIGLWVDMEALNCYQDLPVVITPAEAASWGELKALY